MASKESSVPVSAPETETFDALQEQGNFVLAPCEGVFDFEDKSRFTKLHLSPEQSIHIRALMQQAPNILVSGVLANAYTVKFPEGLPHTLTALKQGGVGSMIRGESGRFVGSASFYSMAPEAILMGAFTAMSIASSQYFLAQINNQMQMMHLKIDEILAFLYGDKKAELLSEMSFIQYAYQNYGSIMAHNVQRIATVASLQSAKKVAMKDIEFYISDLDAAVSRRAKDYEDLAQHVDKAFQIRESLCLSQQLYVMSSMMEVFYSQNLDSAYLGCLEHSMLAYIDKCDKRMLGSFSKLDGQLNAYKPKPMEKVDKTEAEKKIHAVVDSLNNGEESDLRKSVRSSLQAANQSAEYYLSSDGNVYVKAG